MKYIYPKLPAIQTTPFCRIGGNGLANCLFVYAKAIVKAQKIGAKIITPTWFNISLGPYLRKQRDKRHYMGIFNSKNEISGLKKTLLLWFNKDDIQMEEGIYDFFQPLIGYESLIKSYLLEHINPCILKEVDNFEFNGCAAVHVRLGDFLINRRVPMEWYIEKIGSLSGFKKILIFSDGTDEELSCLMTLNGVERAFFGGAIQDIVAISRCSYLIGSDSSFSAWGAFFGQMPCVFYRLQFGTVLSNPEFQTIEHK